MWPQLKLVAGAYSGIPAAMSFSSMPTVCNGAEGRLSGGP